MVFRKIEDETILVPIRRSAGDLDNIYVLNDVAAMVWELIDGKRSMEEIRDAIREEIRKTIEGRKRQGEMEEWLRLRRYMSFLRSMWKRILRNEKGDADSPAPPSSFFR